MSRDSRNYELIIKCFQSLPSGVSGAAVGHAGLRCGARGAPRGLFQPESPPRAGWTPAVRLHLPGRPLAMSTYATSDAGAGVACNMDLYTNTVRTVEFSYRNFAFRNGVLRLWN